MDAAAAAVERKQQELGAKDAALGDAAAKLEHQQAAAAAAADELERQRKALEAARRGLAGVEAALDAREAQMGESWGQLAANTAALKAGDLDGLSTRATVSLSGGVGWGRGVDSWHLLCEWKPMHWGSLVLQTTAQTPTAM